MAALHESTDFPGNAALPGSWQDDVYRYCTFAGLDLEGEAFQGLLDACVLSDCAWYWGLFNCTRFIEVEFRHCVFRGAAFASCIFVNCRFVNCRFVRDNMGSPCKFENCTWSGCEQLRCEGLPHADAMPPLRRVDHPGGLPHGGDVASTAGAHSPPMK